MYNIPCLLFPGRGGFYFYSLRLDFHKYGRNGKKKTVTPFFSRHLVWEMSTSICLLFLKISEPWRKTQKSAILQLYITVPTQFVRWIPKQETWNENEKWKKHGLSQLTWLFVGINKLLSYYALEQLPCEPLNNSGPFCFHSMYFKINHDHIFNYMILMHNAFCKSFLDYLKLK